MADFKTHVTFSSAIGAGYAVVGSGLGFDLSTAIVAGGLCGVSGMLPDVDSDSGVPRRESLGFAAAIVPMLLIDRFRQFELSHDQIVLLGAVVYFCVRFLAANLIGKWSVHRGMWHSIPAVLIFAGLAFLISGPNDTPDAIFVRYLKAGAVALGAFSHLLLDEIYSVDTRGVVPRLKKSFGTAIKFWGKNPMANFSTYAKLAVVVAAIFMDVNFLERLELRNPELAGKVRDAKQSLQGARERVAQLPSVSEFSERVRRDEPATNFRESLGLGDRSAYPAERPAPVERPTERPAPREWLPSTEGFAPPRFAPIGQPNPGGGGFVPNRGAPPETWRRY